jgi:hypothetical protein
VLLDHLALVVPVERRPVVPDLLELGIPGEVVAAAVLLIPPVLAVAAMTLMVFMVLAVAVAGQVARLRRGQSPMSMAMAVFMAAVVAVPELSALPLHRFHVVSVLPG